MSLSTPIPFTFKVSQPEKNIESVVTPQMLIAKTTKQHIQVIIYFMANRALTITGGNIRSAMGKIKLYYTAETKSGAYTASVTPRKVIFTFTSPQGIANNFEFHGQTNDTQ